MSELSELKSKYGHNKELKAKMNAGIVGMRSVEMKLMCSAVCAGSNAEGLQPQLHGLCIS